jgi:hypothetical protein
MRFLAGVQRALSIRKYRFKVQGARFKVKEKKCSAFGERK